MIKPAIDNHDNMVNPNSKVKIYHYHYLKLGLKPRGGFRVSRKWGETMLFFAFLILNNCLNYSEFLISRPIFTYKFFRCYLGWKRHPPKAQWAPRKFMDAINIWPYWIRNPLSRFLLNLPPILNHRIRTKAWIGNAISLAMFTTERAFLFWVSTGSPLRVLNLEITFSAGFLTDVSNKASELLFVRRNCPEPFKLSKD